MKMVLASIFLLISLLSLNANSELVILRVYDSGNGSNTTTSSSDFQSCALYRNHVGLGSSPNYQLYDLNLFTYCSQFTVNSNTSFAQNAVFFMPKTPFDCSFRRMANNLLADGASLALIASDGPFNYSYVDPTNQVGMAFFPQYIGRSLQDKLNTYQLPYVNVYSFSTNQFDPSIIITLGIALITVIAIAEWNLYKFKKRLGKKAAKLKAPTSNNPEISTVTKGFEDAMMSNISGHPSINDLPMPPMDSSGPNETNEPSSRTRGIEAKETANNKKEAVLNKSKEVLNKTKKFVKSGKIMDFTFGYLNIAIICVVLVGLVLLVYYFYPVMVWIISVLFAIIACITLYVMGEKILSHRFLKFLHYRIPDNNIPVLKKKPKVISLVWLVICIAFCAIWLGFRRSDWAWVFQDIMVLCLVKYTLSFNLFRSYHVVMVLLGIICVYETFMIFILPLFAQRATIFSAVLFGFKTSYDSWYERPENYNYIDFTSPNSFDWLPLYLIIPNVYDFRKLCHRFLTFPYTVLGIGDIVFPAMSINYALIYDVAKGKRFPLFFFLNLVGYCFSYFLVGLIGSFVKTALPPMLFLAPILIAINTIIPYLYKDLQPYLNGDPIKDYTANQINQLLS